MSKLKNELVRTRNALPLFVEAGVVAPPPPTTRFQGSKLKLLEWIWDSIRDMEFETVLDAFGGSASVAHYLKGKGKAVTFNDIMRWNCLCAQAIVANDHDHLSEEDIAFVLRPHESVRYDDVVERTFHDIYFTDEENRWLDMVAQNIPRLRGLNKRALAYYALFQAAISKRPYNLFHRKNLYMRLAKVKRSFGNKVTWDKPFELHFRDFVRQANAAVFSSETVCSVTNVDAAEVQGDYDLVYIDPPYVNARGVGVDYHGFYHFLEGLATYDTWAQRIDHDSKHKRLKPQKSPWTNSRRVRHAFRAVFERFADSVLVVSYRSDGIPSLDDLVGMLREFKSHVRLELLTGSYTYALSTNRRSTEALIVAS